MTQACPVCRARTATIMVHRVVNGVSSPSAICATCAEARGMAVALDDSPCERCGRPFHVEMVTTAGTVRRLCEACATLEDAT